MSTPYKDKNSGVYKLRKRIPVELQPLLGKKEYWQSLGTKDLKEAKRLFPAALDECERQFELARAKLENRTYRLSDREAKALAGDWLKARLRATESLPEREQVEMTIDVHGDMLRAGKFAAWVPDTKEVVEHHSLPIVEGTDAFKILLKAVAQADYQYYLVQAKRLGNDWRDVEVENYPKLDIRQLSAASQDSDSIRLSELLVLYKKEDKPDVRREYELDKHVGSFIELHGDLSISMIEKAHVKSMKDQMVNAALNYRTVNGRLSKLTVVLDYAVLNGLLDENPAKGIRALKPKEDTSKPRLTYTEAQLKIIFGGPVHTENKRPIGGKGEAAYWMPLIALYSGARLSEIAQLYKEDFHFEEGVQYFEIHRKGIRTTKNRNSIRRAPVHQRLIDLGFLRYVERSKGGRIFPLVDVPKELPSEDGKGKGQIAKNWGQWFGRYKRKMGVPAPKGFKLDFHSFRHTFIDACRESAVDPELRMKITGHKPQEVGATYGTKNLIRRLKEEIDKVEYDLGGLT